MAYTTTKRSLKAQNQARDRFGRWVSVGANVKWNTNGKDFAGVIDHIENGQASITVTHPDGSKTKTSVNMNRLRVLASKATLPTDATTLHNDSNSFADALKDPAVKETFDKNGAANIQRVDGYQLSLSQKVPKDTSNPIMYQLYAPGGRSLGTYDQSAVGDFDAMVSEDQAGAQAADPAPAGDVVIASADVKPYAVPAQVAFEVSQALSDKAVGFSTEDLEIANRLATEPHVSLSDVQWINSFFTAHDNVEKLHGGFKGKKWSSKIINPPVEKTAQVSFSADENLEYFAVSEVEGSTLSNKLFAIDREADQVFEWVNELTRIPEMSVADFEAPQITPLGISDAEAFATILDSGAETFDILDLDPQERNLFSLAVSEIDFEQLDRVSAIIADATGYSPLERSVNATKQRRGPGGKFGDQGSGDKPSGGDPKVQKATLPMELPLVGDVATRISDWISTAAEAPIMAAGVGPAQTDSSIEDSATGPSDEALYFAIVDDVDKTAVMDAVAIVKIQGAPNAYLRQQAQWVASPDTLTDFQGTTPPPVVEMQTPEPVKTVLAQIDAHDAEKPPADAGTGAPVVASAGFSLPDGTLTVLDSESLSEAVLSVSKPTLLQKQHLRKRAFALNRMDLLPEDWRSLSVGERGELYASETILGDFGEITPVIASGKVSGHLTGAAKLREYWTHGKGALKIRWGSKGDLTRAHRHLEKFVPGHGWGLAQAYHQYLFGVSNYKRDHKG